jgi:hypothetical protein
MSAGIEGTLKRVRPHKKKKDGDVKSPLQETARWRREVAAAKSLETKEKTPAGMPALPGVTAGGRARG